MAVTSIRVVSALDASQVILELRLAADAYIADVKTHVERLAHLPGHDQLFLSPEFCQPLEDHIMLSELSFEEGGDLHLVVQQAPIEVYEDELFKQCMGCDCDVWENVECFGCWCQRPPRELKEWHINYILEALPFSSWISVQHVFESCLRSGRTKAANLLVQDERVRVQYRLLQDPVWDWFEQNDRCFWFLIEWSDYCRISDRLDNWIHEGGFMQVSHVGHVRKCVGQARPTKGSCRRKRDITRASATESAARVSRRKEGRNRTLHKTKARLEKSWPQQLF